MVEISLQTHNGFELRLGQKKTRTTKLECFFEQDKEKYETNQE